MSTRVLAGAALVAGIVAYRPMMTPRAQEFIQRLEALQPDGNDHPEYRPYQITEPLESDSTRTHRTDVFAIWRHTPARISGYRVRSYQRSKG